MYVCVCVMEENVRTKVLQLYFLAKLFLKLQVKVRFLVNEQIFAKQVPERMEFEHTLIMGLVMYLKVSQMNMNGQNNASCQRDVRNKPNKVYKTFKHF